MRKQLERYLWGRWPDATVLGLCTLSAYFYYFLGAMKARFGVDVLGYGFMAKHLLLYQFLELPVQLLHPGWVLGFLFSWRFVKVCRSKRFTESFLVLPEMQSRLFGLFLWQVFKIAILTEIGMRLASWFFLSGLSGRGRLTFALFRRTNVFSAEASPKVVFGETAFLVFVVVLKALFVLCAFHVVSRIYQTRKWISWVLLLPVAVAFVGLVLSPNTLHLMIKEVAGQEFSVNENVFYATAGLIVLGIDVAVAAGMKRRWATVVDAAIEPRTR